MPKGGARRVNRLISCGVMEIVLTEDFFSWAAGRGIEPDRAPPEAGWVSFEEGVGDDRFWVVPERAAGIPFFLGHLLAGLEAWNACYVWPRGGTWVDDRERVNVK